jgi:hypothetical protein
MINASAQYMPVVVSCNSVLDLAPIVARNLSVGVAVAIHNLGNQLINFGNITLQFESLRVVRCIFIFFFFRCFLFVLFGFFFNARGNGIGGGGAVDFVCSYGWSICFQWCPFDSRHGSIAFLLQWGVQFGVCVGVVTRHFPVLKLTQEWGIKNSIV